MDSPDGSAPMGEYARGFRDGYKTKLAALTGTQQAEHWKNIQTGLEAENSTGANAPLRLFGSDRLCHGNQIPRPRACRYSVDYTSIPLLTCTFPTRYRSLSDSELDKSSSLCATSSSIPTSTKMTAEYMDLPTHLTDRSLPLSLDSFNLAQYSSPSPQLQPTLTHTNTNTSSSSQHHIESQPQLPLTIIPRIQFETPDLTAVEDTCYETYCSPYLQSLEKYTDHHCETEGPQTTWAFLDGQEQIYLNPSSCNGSVSSVYSSNTDSAIDILTPEEEVQETQLWKNSSDKNCNSSNQTSETDKMIASASQCIVNSTQTAMNSVPQVIISDFSATVTQDNPVQDSLNQANFICSNSFDEVFMKLTRSLSGSSISSTDSASTWSCFSDSSHEHESDIADTPIPYKKKVRIDLFIIFNPFPVTKVM